MRETVMAGAYEVDRKDLMKAVRMTGNIAGLGSKAPGIRAAVYYDEMSKRVWAKAVYPGRKPEKGCEGVVHMVCVTYRRMGYEELRGAIANMGKL